MKLYCKIKLINTVFTIQMKILKIRKTEYKLYQYDKQLEQSDYIIYEDI